MSEEFLFFNYLVEMYASYKQKSAGEVLRSWEKHGLTQKIYDSYIYYHAEAIENAFKDIDSLMATGEHAW